MNKLLILLIGVAAVSAVFVKKTAADPNLSVFAQLEQLEDHEMGRKLLDTIALQLKNKSPLGDIAKMLQELRENLLLQQSEADQKHAADEAECEAEIYGYNRRIDFASNEITDSTNEINSLTATKDFLEAEISNKNKQLEILNSQEEQLRAQRIQDHADFESRQAQTPKVIDALDVITSKLSAIQPEADAEAVLAELHRIGGDNPILALVSLASTFSPEKLESVNGKILELRQSLVQSIEDDREAETQAEIDFRNLLEEFAAQREALTSALNDAIQKLAQTEQLLAIQKKRKDDAARELAAATAGKTQKEADCLAWRTQYENDTAHRTQEISIIRQVEEILATKLEGASSYLKDRIGA